MFTQAIRIDTSQADPYVGLGEALCYAGIFGFRPSAETYREARTAARKALEIDPSSPGAHNVLADVKKGYDWKLTDAESEYKRALKFNPSHGQCGYRKAAEILRLYAYLSHVEAERRSHRAGKSC